MTINLQIPTSAGNLKPTITVVGVGGAGGNAVNNMIAANLEGVSFVMANTDAQALDNALTDRVIQLGAHITQGLGAGASPDIGRASAEEAEAEILSHIEGSHMVFITAGMGGGTGTGAAPVVARMARELGILTVAVVTKPFHFEGTHRMKLAEAGLDELQNYVDTMIVIPNQNLFRVANEKTTFADAFRMADEVLHSGVRGVTDLMVMPGLINLDFADIRTVMREMGKAMMGTGEATGEHRAVEAAEAAISNPLLDDVSMKGARGVLINITGGHDMTLFEVDEAANRIRDEVDPDANIIFGSTFNDALEGRMRISVVATGIDQQEFKSAKPEDEDQPTTRVFSQRPLAAAAAPKPAFFQAPRPVAIQPAVQEVVEENPEEEMVFVAEEAEAAEEMVVEEARDQGKLLFSESREAAVRTRHSPTRVEARQVADERKPAAPRLSPATEASLQQAEPAFRGTRNTEPRAPRVRPAAVRDAQPALWQEEEALEQASNEPNFLKRMTARFTPREDQPIRRTEVTSARPAEPAEGGDYLEIPAFLRRQAN